MLMDAFIAAAQAGGLAVAGAAGTDAWTTVRTKAARLLGRGEQQGEEQALARLDATLSALEAAAPGDEAAHARTAQSAAWQTRFEALLEGTPEAGREQLASELEALKAEADRAADFGTVRNDFRHATFRGPVQGSGHQTINYYQR
ncbi:hypothetical protein [Streptomyces sp. NPDC007088]|uniref:hypothetical protein n=1 Tax=Streptomyces sp. NPDC007088 TaxID=3364773 RepID=UPI00369C6D7F